MNALLVRTHGLVATLVALFLVLGMTTVAVAQTVDENVAPAEVTVEASTDTPADDESVTTDESAPEADFAFTSDGDATEEAAVEEDSASSTEVDELVVSVAEAVAASSAAATLVTPTAPELSTDKDDYHPGETVTVFGRFFTPLKNFVVRIFGNSEFGNFWSDTSYTVQSDDAGSFSFSHLLDNFYRPTYDVTATDEAGDIVAELTFTDAAGASVDEFSQCANDDGDGYGGNPGTCSWTNGNMNAQNSTILEEDATVQRLLMSGLTNGSHVVTLEYQTTKGGKHAYDFLTDYNLTESWVTQSDLCSAPVSTGFPGCAAGTMSFSPDIPHDPNNTHGNDDTNQNIAIINGAITNISTPTLVSGSYAADSLTQINVTFTVDTATCANPDTKGQTTTCPVFMTWGAHVSSQADWGDGQSAVNISGSPYHMKVVALDGGSTGNRDNQMQADAIIIPTTGTIVVDKITNPSGDATSFNFAAGGTGYSDFSLTDQAAPNSQVLNAGTYSIAETVPTGWVQTSAVCLSSIGDTETPGSIELDPEETVTCTFTNTKNGSITIEKQVVGTDKDFTFTGDVSGSLGDNDTATQSVVPGTYQSTETTDAAYALTSIICNDGDSTGDTNTSIATFNVAAGENVTCVFTNSELPTLELQKTVVNDNGGLLDESDFQAYISGSPVAWDAPQTMVPGDYTASEDTQPTYQAGSWGGHCAANGSVSLAYGDHKVCTITNDDNAPTLKLVKTVTNDNGGNAVPNDWTLTATGDSGFSNAGGSGSFETVKADVSYTLSESGPSGYTAGSWSCDGGTQNGATITLALDQDVTCTINNDDIAPSITLIKAVINDNGGTAGVNDFGLTIDGVAVNSGDTRDVNANTPIPLNEAGLAGYSFVDITGDAKCPAILGGTATLDEDEHITCTITNNDQQAYITVVKVVNDSYGGGAQPDDFALTLDGNAVLSGVQHPVNPGTYVAAETLVAGYAFDGFSDQCDSNGSITVALGESKTCTLTNHDLAGAISGYKFEDVNGNGVWDNGEPALENWQINLDGDATDSDTTDANGYYEFTGLAKGTYTLTETQQAGWLQTTANPAPIDLVNGAVVTDINFGNFELGEVHGVKFHDLDGDGAAQENGEPLLSGWSIRLYNTATTPWTLVDTDITDGVGAYSFNGLEPGSYKVCEVLQTGWIETFASSPSANASPSASEEGPQCQTVNIDTSGETNGRNFGNYEAKDLTVSKDAATTYTRTFGWTIDKSVTPDTLDMFTGDSDDVTYTVAVTKDAGVDSAWAASGSITITNPNPVASGLDATVTSVTDSMTGGINATVDCPSSTVPAGGQLVCTYSTNLPDGTNRTNTATVETSGIVGGGEGTAAVIFGEPTTLVNDTIDVDDTNGSSWKFGDNGQVTYDRTFLCDADEGEHGNTATIRQTGQSDDADVTVNCYDITVTKDATTAFTRTFDWDITKSVDEDALHLFSGDSDTVEYTVSVTKDAGTDSDFMVEGTIMVTNNAPIDATINEVTDSMTGGLDAVVDCGGAGPYVVTANGGTLVCTYSRSLADASSLTNTATAVLANSPSGTTDYTGTADVTFGEPDTLVNNTVDVNDLLDGNIEKINEEIEVSKVYTYEHEYFCDADAGQHTNVAKVVGDDDEELGSDDATVAVNCYDLHVTKDAATSFTRTWTWTIDKTGSETTLDLPPGMTYPINYSVDVDAGSADGAHAVTGSITIVNPAPMAATVSVTDSMTGDIDGDVVCSSDTVPAAGQLVCTYSADLPNADLRTNTATVSLTNGTQYTGTTSVDFTGATMTEVDAVADLTDSLYGDLGTIDANVDTLPKTFPYTYEVGPYEVEQCGNSYQVDNTATVTPRDSGTDVEDTWSVNVNVQCVCSLTQGFWKTHNDSFEGGAPAYDGWLLLDADKELAGFFTTDALTSAPATGPNAPSLTWFDVFWTAPKGNAYYNLAHQYMAAKLNVLSGAGAPGIDAALLQAENLLKQYKPSELVPPKGKAKKAWDVQYGPIRDQMIGLAGIFGAFNEGTTNPAGHCSEPPLANY